MILARYHCSGPSERHTEGLRRQRLNPSYQTGNENTLATIVERMAQSEAVEKSEMLTPYHVLKSIFTCALNAKWDATC